MLIYLLGCLVTFCLLAVCKIGQHPKYANEEWRTLCGASLLSWVGLICILDYSK